MGDEMLAERSGERLARLSRAEVQPEELDEDEDDDEEEDEDEPVELYL